MSCAVRRLYYAMICCFAQEGSNDVETASEFSSSATIESHCGGDKQKEKRMDASEQSETYNCFCIPTGREFLTGMTIHVALLRTQNRIREKFSCETGNQNRGIDEKVGKRQLPPIPTGSYQT